MALNARPKIIITIVVDRLITTKTWFISAKKKTGSRKIVVKDRYGNKKTFLDIESQNHKMEGILVKTFNFTIFFSFLLEEHLSCFMTYRNDPKRVLDHDGHDHFSVFYVAVLDVPALDPSSLLDDTHQ